MAGEVLSDETVYRGARFDVARVALAGRHGEAVTREVVRPSDAVVILPVVEAELGTGTASGATVVMIRNRRWAVGQTLWELPAGTLEPGEDPAACAQRELAEETGYRLRPGVGRIEQLAEFYPSPGFCTEKLTLFRASGLAQGAQDLDPTEAIEVHPMPASEAIGRVTSGEVRDGKTIAGLMWLHKMLGDRASARSGDTHGDGNG
jgi:ADP-ribose pyrophosphatase